MKYRYVGDGAGIIGLPHVISDDEAEQAGPEVVELLKAAIENGSYTPVGDQQKAVSYQQRSASREKSKQQKE